MPSTVLSAATLGIDAYPVHVEVDTVSQMGASRSDAAPRTLPTVTILGTIGR